MKYILSIRKGNNYELTSKEYEKIKKILLQEQAPKFIEIRECIINTFDIVEIYKKEPLTLPDFKDFNF